MKYRIAGRDWEDELSASTDPSGLEWSVHDPESGEERTARVLPDESDHHFRFILDGIATSVTILPDNRPGRPLRLIVDDEYVEIECETELDRVVRRVAASAATSGRTVVESAMPGVIREVSVSIGQAVELGEKLGVLEAMKMENVLEAPAAGVVTEISIAAGDTVSNGQAMFVIEPAE